MTWSKPRTDPQIFCPINFQIRINNPTELAQCHGRGANRMVLDSCRLSDDPLVGHHQREVPM